jgi:membrane-associated phospholipid phosphatase
MSGVTVFFGAGLARLYAVCTASIRRTFADHIPLYICAVVFSIATICIVLHYHLVLPLDESIEFLILVPKFFVLGFALAALRRLIVMIRTASKERPLVEISRWLCAQILAEDRSGNVFHSLVALMPLTVSFVALKDEIPQINPFSWDQTFLHWDRIIGLGRTPAEILQPILGHPIITSVLNFNYDIWFLVMFGSLLWQAFAAKGGLLRTQFLLGFAFCWFIGGNVLAAVFSSAGPCFYGHLFAHDPYAAQMAYLRATSVHWPIWSVQVQDMLWQSYATGTGDVTGISAMPSMHVTSSVLIALLGWRTNRWLGAGLWLFTALIAIGSVALGWHYAVDSIAGIVLALVFWYAAGALARAAWRLISAPSATA